MWGSNMDGQNFNKNFFAGQTLKKNLDFNPKVISKKSILLIEDDLDFAQVMAELLEDYVDLRVDVAADPYEAMTRLSEKSYDYVVLDWFLQEMTGKKTMEKVENLYRLDPDFPARRNSRIVPVIVMSAHNVDQIQPFKGDHFKYQSFVSKRQSLKDILNQLKEEVGNPYDEEVSGY